MTTERPEKLTAPPGRYFKVTTYLTGGQTYVEACYEVKLAPSPTGSHYAAVPPSEPVPGEPHTLAISRTLTSIAAVTVEQRKLPTQDPYRTELASDPPEVAGEKGTRCGGPVRQGFFDVPCALRKGHEGHCMA